MICAGRIQGTPGKHGHSWEGLPWRTPRRRDRICHIMIVDHQRDATGTRRSRRHLLDIFCYHKKSIAPTEKKETTQTPKPTTGTRKEEKETVAKR